jgi:hypothetical protein
LIESRTVSFPDSRERGNGIRVADLEPDARCADEDCGEVLEQQGDRRRGVLRVEFVAVALLLCAAH